MIDEDEKEYELLLNKALIEAQDKFYKVMAKEGYEDYIAFDMTAYILSTDYDYILKSFNHSNLGSFLKPKELLKQKG